MTVFVASPALIGLFYSVRIPVACQSILKLLSVYVFPIGYPVSLLFIGSTHAVTRKEIWSNKRVLFLTPQVMVNDLSRGACPAAEIKCLVIDEAHKALGNYAYCQVIFS